MKYIIKISPEISIKSKAVKKRAIKLLTKNIKIFLSDFLENLDVRYHWDKIEINILKDIDNNLVESILKNISWIAYISLINSYPFETFEDILKVMEGYYIEKINWKSFCVRVKRSWEHNFKSIDAEKHIWWWLLKNSINSYVKLKDPEIQVDIEIKDNDFYIINKKLKWIWWYPIWFQDKVLSLISWWFDSWVSTFLSMKRWCKTDFLFFNLWWNAHELWVKQVVYYLWKNFSKPYKANFISINFEEIIKELIEKINPRFRAILLKRLMLKTASMFEKRWYYAIVKWDSLWQVSSQTLKNMFVIDKASSILTLRPLIWFDKQEIVDISREIWTYDYACSMPEYCGVVSNNPATWAKLEDIEKEEEKIDISIIERCFENRKIEKVENMLDLLSKESSNIEIKDEISKNELIIDLREKEKIERNPLKIENKIEIPFFKINSEFKNLDQDKEYLFYCDKWVLSNLHALYLKEKWFNNIKIFRPKIIKS